MSKYTELERKGIALLELRDKATGSQREVLNREIKALRQAQLKELASECVEAFNIAIPEMVNQAIQSSDVVKAIEELREELRG